MLLRTASEVTVGVGQENEDDFRRLLATVAAGNARRLNLDAFGTGGATARALASTPAWRSLDGLRLTGADLSADDVAALTSATLLGDLRRLSLRRCTLGTAALQVLFAWPGCRSLTSLDLGGTILGQSDASALAASPHLEGLRELRPEGCRVDEAGVTELARSQTLNAVETFAVAGNGLVPDAVTALGGRLFDGDTLVLRSTRLGDEGLAAILGVWGGRTCRNLGLSNCNLTTAGVSALAAHPGLASVATLDLTRNPLGPLGIAALFRSPYLGRLGRLWLMDAGATPTDADGAWHWPPLLRSLHLTDDETGSFIESLATHPLPPGLRELRFTEAKTTPADLPGLLDALPAGLEILELDRSPLGDEGARRIADSVRMRSLRELGVSYCDIGGVGLAAVLSSPNLEALRVLNATGSPLTSGMVLDILAGPCPTSLRRLSFAAERGAYGAVDRLRRAKAFRGVAELSVQYR